jgi:hypothetical protein
LTHVGNYVGHVQSSLAFTALNLIDLIMQLLSYIVPSLYVLWEVGFQTSCTFADDLCFLDAIGKNITQEGTSSVNGSSFLIAHVDCVEFFLGKFVDMRDFKDFVACGESNVSSLLLLCLYLQWLFCRHFVVVQQAEKKTEGRRCSSILQEKREA